MSSSTLRAVRPFRLSASPSLLIGCAASSALLAPAALAQGPAFTSPGAPPRSTLGQTTRFSTEFNPAMGVVIDTIADWRDTPMDDGFDIQARLVEFNVAAFLDPNAWGYVVFTSEDLGSPEIEEAAIQLMGLGDRTTMKVGSFFIDFGKQMQQHIEELRTVERPLVLREYLGEELGGTGAQIDHWLPLGDATPVRVSFGVFGSLVGEVEDDDGGPVAAVPEFKDVDEVSFTARVTSLHETSESGTLQLGASARVIPDFTFTDDASGLTSEGLSNGVYGLDLTYGWTSETGEQGLTTGVEWLFVDGDLGAAVDDAGTPLDASDDFLGLNNDSGMGFYGFVDYGFSSTDNVGVQYSEVDLLSDTDITASEVEVYWTHYFTELRRMRLGASRFDVEGGDEESRIYLQFTAYFGSHSHGVNW